MEPEGLTDRLRKEDRVLRGLVLGWVHGGGQVLASHEARFCRLVVASLRAAELRPTQAITLVLAAAWAAPGRNRRAMSYRERKLLKKIEQSIARIDAGDYGYCDETGEPIGVGRLIARPTATLSLEAQQRRELKQKMFGD